jgi:hypothetical protein
MSNDNTKREAEPSLASAGSHGDERRAAFERWADVWGLRISKRSSGRYLDSATQWAWNGWSAATLTDEERAAFKLASEWCRSYGGAVYDAGRAIERFLERTKCGAAIGGDS